MTDVFDKSRRFYENKVAPMLHEKFPEYESRIAVGLAGEGSDCFGFDDFISRDHDFGTGTCLWVTEEDFHKFGRLLSIAYNELVDSTPGADLTDRLRQRRGVMTIDGFYSYVLGTRVDAEGNSITDETWRRLDHSCLATAVNGEIFRDDLGKFSAFRKTLLDYYPDEIWRERIANELHRYASSLQVNYSRCMARKDTVAAQICKSTGLQAAMELFFLLKRTYPPYYKWTYRALEALDTDGRFARLVKELAETGCTLSAWQHIKFTFNVLGNMRNISLIYYCGWVVRGNQYGARAAIQATFQMIALSPMGPGIALVLPMVKKLGRTKTIWMGSILTIIGSVFAYAMAGNRMYIMIGTALAAIGNIAFSYLIMSYMGDVIDHVEWKSGTRCDGLTGGFVSAALMFAVGIAQGLFNLGLMITKYAQPAEIGLSAEGVKLYADQPAAATGWINFSYQGTYIVMGIMIFLVFKFLFDLEKKMPQVSTELQDRRVAEYAAHGMEYLPPAELERREIEAQKAETEANRIADLKARCEKQGLDFEAENQKYLDKLAAKQAKAEAKAARKAAKAKK